MSLSIVILAAGQGTRMKSDMPKVLQPLAGRPMLSHVLDTAEALGAGAIHVVIGHGADAVRAAHGDRDVRWVMQEEQLGTGHAVAQALDHIEDQDTVLVLCGDVPLVGQATLRPVADAGEDGLAVLTVEHPDPGSYGRIIRGPSGNVARIVEHRDASPEELAVNEINTGLLAAPAASLKRWIGRLGNDNAQGEYYLTDIVGLAVDEGVTVQGIGAARLQEVEGINDKLQLAEAEAVMRRLRAEALMRDGVTIIDPARVELRGDIQCGRDVYIDVNVVLEGEVTLEEGVHVGPNAVLRDVHLGAHTEILANVVMEGARTGADCIIGPFARIRPDTKLADRVKIGNFVEAKKSDIATGSKVNHLTYVGDSNIGEGVNVGAGTITCNYDGANKHPTTIGDGAFIGSGVMLVAPVKVGARAVIGAGSVISKEAPAEQLSVARSRQVVVKGWKRPQKTEPK